MIRAVRDPTTVYVPFNFTYIGSLGGLDYIRHNETGNFFRSYQQEHAPKFGGWLFSHYHYSEKADHLSGMLTLKEHIILESEADYAYRYLRIRIAHGERPEQRESWRRAYLGSREVKREGWRFKFVTKKGPA